MIILRCVLVCVCDKGWGLVQGECGARTPLGTEVIQQARDEQDTYIQELLEEVGYGAVDVTVKELSRAFTIIDPRIGECSRGKWRWVQKDG